MNVSLRLATKKDKSLVVAFDYALDKDEHIKLKREEKITKAISDKECFIVLADSMVVGFVIFDYRFFAQRHSATLAKFVFCFHFFFPLIFHLNFYFRIFINFRKLIAKI
jgi:hypothetical protein